jgi:hypothetical protein
MLTMAITERNAQQSKAAPQPAYSGTTNANNVANVTTVPTTPKRKVTYVLKATTSSNLSMPYAVSVNGKALAAYDKKPARVSGSGGKITVTADAGAKVALYLNSDAHPSYRTQPVYEVTPNDRDVLVTITEKPGKHADKDTPALKAGSKPKDGAAPSTPAGSSGSAKTATGDIDEYTAVLTGDIWMKVSHKYTAAEVDALMPAGTSAEVIAAIKSIYNGLRSETLNVSIPAQGGKAASTLAVKFEDSSNPKNNINNYTLLGDGLTRVHPAGYAALFSSAIEDSVDKLVLSSCWRPMLGSIAHRAGLGLDVEYVGKTLLNRQELRRAFLGKKPSGKGDGDDTDNVSDAEVTAFGEFEDADAAYTKSQAELVAARNASAAAKKTNDPAKIATALANEKAARAAADAAAVEQAAAQKAWNDERNAAEPTSVRRFRERLLKCTCVRQLFDPWFMDGNTHDKTDPVPNLQRGKETSNERLHAHHLHVTVDEPKIL